MTYDEALTILRDESMTTAEQYSLLTSRDWGQGLQHLPGYMQEGILRWVCFGIKPGSFQCAVIEGDLFGAASKADSSNKAMLWHYANFFWNYTPSGCWGDGALNNWKGLYRHDT